MRASPTVASLLAALALLSHVVAAADDDTTTTSSSAPPVKSMGKIIDSGVAVAVAVLLGAAGVLLTISVLELTAALHSRNELQLHPSLEEAEAVAGAQEAQKVLQHFKEVGDERVDVEDMVPNEDGRQDYKSQADSKQHVVEGAAKGSRSSCPED